MASVSSATRAPSMVEPPSAKAAHTKARFVRLLDPGTSRWRRGPGHGADGPCLHADQPSMAADRGPVAPAISLPGTRRRPRLDEQDQHALGALGGVGDLQVHDVDVEVGGQDGDVATFVAILAADRESTSSTWRSPTPARACRVCSSSSWSVGRRGFRAGSSPGATGRVSMRVAGVTHGPVRAPGRALDATVALPGSKSIPTGSSSAPRWPGLHARRRPPRRRHRGDGRRAAGARRRDRRRLGADAEVDGTAAGSRTGPLRWTPACRAPPPASSPRCWRWAAATTSSTAPTAPGPPDGAGARRAPRSSA